MFGGRECVLETAARHVRLHNMHEYARASWSRTGIALGGNRMAVTAAA